MNNFTLKVEDIRIETIDTLTLCFKQPALRKIKYKAGQYLTLIFRINGRRYLRPYSFSSAPSVDALLEVTIKKVVNGIVSNYIHNYVKIGDAIEVMPPMGDFVFDAEEKIKIVYFWGSGSGITPLISIIKEILVSNDSINVNLIYGNKNFDRTIFSVCINELEKKYQGQFKAWHCYSQPVLNEFAEYILEGRINKDFIRNILKDIDLTQTKHYICGSIGLKDIVKEALSELNVSKDQILSEDFELIKKSEDFQDIQTHLVKLIFQDQQNNLEVVKGKSILECALNAGIELPYSCQTGNCSTCKARLKEGQLKMIGLSKQRDDLGKEEYLLCCSYPLTDNVFIEVNN